MHAGSPDRANRRRASSLAVIIAGCPSYDPCCQSNLGSCFGWSGAGSADGRTRWQPGGRLAGRGVGRELMDRAETRARERGCHSAWLDTFSFQARGFYEKRGYEEFGQLDYPPDHHRHFMQKRLTPRE